MDFQTLALSFAREVVQKGGVWDWRSETERAELIAAACQMAEQVLLYEAETMAKEDYLSEGTTLLINGEVGANYAWSVEGLATAAGRVSARIDLGAAPRPYLYRWRCKLACQATPTASTQITLHKSESDGTLEDGDVGTDDGALVAAQKANMRQFGAVTVDTADTSDQIAGGVLECHERYLSLGIWNASGATINATDSNFKFNLTPIAYQQQ